MKYSRLILAPIVAAIVACSSLGSKQDTLQLVSLEELAQLEAQHDQQLAKSNLPIQAEPGQLVLSQPKQASSYANQDSVDEDKQGPVIKILQPLLSSAVTNPLSVHVEFASRQPGTEVNMGSLKLTYKKFWGIDLTDRIVDYIDGNSINAPEVELPEGEHTLEIYIEDENENVSTQLITVVIAEG